MKKESSLKYNVQNATGLKKFKNSSKELDTHIIYNYYFEVVVNVYTPIKMLVI